MQTYRVRVCQCKKGVYAKHDGPGVYIANVHNNGSANLSPAEARYLASRLIDAVNACENRVAKRKLKSKRKRGV